MKAKQISLLIVVVMLIGTMGMAYSEKIILQRGGSTIPNVILSKIFDSYLMFWNNENTNTKNMSSVYQPQVDCTSNWESRLQYNFTSHKYMYCNSTSWVSFP